MYYSNQTRGRKGLIYLPKDSKLTETNFLSCTRLLLSFMPSISVLLHRFSHPFIGIYCPIYSNLISFLVFLSYFSGSWCSFVSCVRLSSPCMSSISQYYIHNIPYKAVVWFFSFWFASPTLRSKLSYGTLFQYGFNNTYTRL